MLLIVGEVHHIKIDTLEELWLLASLDSGEDDVLQIIMIGQSELQDTLRLPELRQLAQRMMATDHPEPMTLDATMVYAPHGLQHAGGTGQEFTTEAVLYMHGETDSILCMVNALCDLALVYAVSAKEKGLSWSRSRRSRKRSWPLGPVTPFSSVPIRLSIA